ncbi:MAG: lycopene beta-cyclase CrtY [Polyangiaceae bacterium]
MNPSSPSFDLVLVGGGLQNCLVALATRTHLPSARIAIVERERALGGNHTWCFHASDVSDEARAWLMPLVSAHWNEWEVRFPSYARRFQRGYSAVTSKRMHDVLSAPEHAEHITFFFGRAAAFVGAHTVLLDDSTCLRAPLVVDARGPSTDHGSCGYQKFIGLELELKSPSPISTPILIDADLPQRDGFRFIYVLPLSPFRLLVEETHFSDTADLGDEQNYRMEILAYAKRAGAQVERIARTERGVLPLPLHLENSPKLAGPIIGGFAGGWFHPTTGYSFPVAVRLATHIAKLGSQDPFGEAWRRLVAEQHRRSRFSMLLNRLLFRATPPSHRRDVFERFHRLPESVIARFYAHASTSSDRMRILCGRPPRGVSVSRAFREVVST